MQTVSLCSVFKLNNKNVSRLINCESVSGFYLGIDDEMYCNC